MNQERSTTKDSDEICDVGGWVSIVLKESQRPPRAATDSCHALKCARLSILIMAAVKTASQNVRFMGGYPISEFAERILMISRARRYSSILEVLCVIPSLGAVKLYTKYFFTTATIEFRPTSQARGVPIPNAR